MKVPMIYQGEYAECGLACLAMVLAAHGSRIDLAALRRQAEGRSEGVRLGRLMEISESRGLACRAVRVELNDLPHLELPALLHWDMDHYVLLTAASDGRYRIHDPAIGPRTVNRRQMDRSFTGVAVEFAPTDELKVGDYTTPLSLLSLWSRSRGGLRAASAILGLSILLQLLTVLSPLFLQVGIDHALQVGYLGLLGALALGFVGIEIAAAVTQLARGHLLVTVGSRLKLQLGRNLIDHLFRLPLAFFNHRSVGDITARVGSLEQVRSQLTDNGIEAVVDAGLVVIALAMMFHYQPVLAVTALLALLAVAALRVWVFQPRLVAGQREQMTADSRERSALIETLSAIQAVKLAGAETQRRAVWTNLFARSIDREASVAQVATWQAVVTRLLIGLQFIASAYLAIRAAIAGHMTVGMVYAYVAFQWRFFGQAESVLDRLFDFLALKVHLERLSDIVHSEPEPVTVPARQAGAVAVAFRRVSFRYAPDQPWILKDVSLTLAPGEHLAITGPSGVGKTTLLKLIIGMERPQEGEVLIDGQPVTSLPPAQLRSLVSAVAQGDQAVLEGTISENVAMFDADRDEQRVREACARAQLLDTIEARPLGFDTRLGVGGVLSGGQLQRLMLARALYRRPSVLLLDEATSHLDEKLEVAICREIGRLQPTRITVAHRAETLRTADRVVELNNGNLRELPGEEKSNGRTFAELVAAHSAA